MSGNKNSGHTSTNNILHVRVIRLINILFFVKQFEKESVIHRMKKVISVSLSIFILTAVLHLSVATHYCGGTIAASKISFSGKIASCGMEDNNQELTPHEFRLVSHCCENVLSFYGINGTYFPTFSFVPESYPYHFQVFSMPAGMVSYSPEPIKSIYTSVNPPGASCCSSVDLSYICIFRI